MKNSRENSKQRSKQIKKNAKRLAAYSAAAAATVLTTQHRTANAADQSFDILDIQTSGSNAVSINFPTQAVGFSVYSSGWSNFSEGNFVITRDWFYAPLSDTTAAFANPATCTTCGTGIAPGPSAMPSALQVFPLPFTAPSVTAGQSFAARSYNSAASGFGNYGDAYYFQEGNAANTNAILGLRFNLSGATHNGWIAISPVGAELMIHGFGYNDTAGAPSIPDLTTVDVPGDINLDGTVDAVDWAALRDNLGADLSAETREDRYAQGDITNDGLNDIRDFDKFREAYEDFNGAGAFEAMVAATVPEPSSILLLAAGAAGMGAWRKRTSS